MSTKLLELQMRLMHALATDDLDALLLLETELQELAWQTGKEAYLIAGDTYGKEYPVVKC